MYYMHKHGYVWQFDGWSFGAIAFAIHFWITSEKLLQIIRTSMSKIQNMRRNKINRIPKIKHNYFFFLDIIYSLLHENFNSMLSFKYNSKSRTPPRSDKKKQQQQKHQRNNGTIPESVKYQINFRFLLHTKKKRFYPSHLNKRKNHGKRMW